LRWSWFRSPSSISSEQSLCNLLQWSHCFSPCSLLLLSFLLFPSQTTRQLAFWTMIIIGLAVAGWCLPFDCVCLCAHVRCLGKGEGADTHEVPYFEMGGVTTLYGAAGLSMTPLMYDSSSLPLVCFLVYRFESFLCVNFTHAFFLLTASCATTRCHPLCKSVSHFPSVGSRSLLWSACLFATSIHSSSCSWATTYALVPYLGCLLSLTSCVVGFHCLRLHYVVPFGRLRIWHQLQQRLHKLLGLQNSGLTSPCSPSI